MYGHTDIFVCNVTISVLFQSVSDVSVYFSVCLFLYVYIVLFVSFCLSMADPLSKDVISDDLDKKPVE